LSQDDIFVNVPILKFEDVDPDDLSKGVFVYGKCTTDDLDLDDQIIDKDFARDALSKWFSEYGNVRQMHSTNLAPAGKAQSMDEKDDGFWLKTKVVEPTAQTLVREGVYSAYSIGISNPRIIRDKTAKHGRVVGGIVSENSLVDFPANPFCKFLIAKRVHRADGDQLRRIGRVEILSEYDLEERAFIGKRGIVPTDFVLEDERMFPIVEPSDVPRAIATWGEYDGDESFSTFKSNLVAIAKSKGEEFLDETPRAWRINDATAEPVAPEDDLTKAVAAPSDDDKKADCETCGGTGKINEGHRDCPDCGASGEASDDAKKIEEPDLEKPEDKVDKKSGKGDDAKPADGDDAKPADGDDAKPKDDGDGDGDGGGADDDDQSHAAPDVDDEGDDESKVAAPEIKKVKKAKRVKKVRTFSTPDELPYASRRLHDILCAAYPTTVIEKVHPLFATSGIAACLDLKPYRDDLSATTDAILKGGSTVEQMIAKTNALTDATVLVQTDPSIFLEQRDELHKSFADMYPKVSVSPTNMTPGAFKKPYTSTGRSPATAPKMDSALPSMNAKTPAPGDFDRGPLTAGQAATPPAQPDARTAPGATGRVYYTNAARSAASAAMQSLHDHIATLAPGLCPMTTEAGAVPGTPIAGAPFANRADAKPSTPTFPPAPGLVKGEGEGEEEPSEDKIEKVMGADLTKAVISSDAFKSAVASALDDIVRPQVAKLRKQNDKLRKRVRDLEGSPDPAKDPVRGSVVVPRAIEKRAAEDYDEGLKRLRAQNEVEQIGYLETLTKSGNPELRLRAEAQLTKLLGRDATDVPS
jgi:hypothetical protein